MADISTEITAIQEAVYGEEVRTAIVDALTAMNDIAEDAEAFAAGTREGTPVGSSDPAYHNSSKYWAEQAAASVNNAMAMSAYVGGTTIAAQTPNTVCWLNVNGCTDAPMGLGDASRIVWLYTSGDAERREQILYSQTMKSIYFRYGAVSSGNVTYSGWNRIEAAYDLYPTGDTTERDEAIRSVLLDTGYCRLAPGDYYMGNGVIMPNYTSIVGAGIGRTRLILNRNQSSNRLYAISAHRGCAIKDLTLEGYVDGQGGVITPVEDYSLGVHGIIVGNTGTDMPGSSSEPYDCCFENINVRNFTGCGILSRHVTQSVHNGSLQNVRVDHCSAGIYLGEKSEYNLVTGCVCNLNYTGIVVMGGNNMISNSEFGSNQINIDIKEADGYNASTGNDGHGVFSGCKESHSVLYGIRCGAQTSSELFSGCMLGGVIYVKDRGQVITFSGCDMRRDDTDSAGIIADNSVIMMMGCVFKTGLLPVSVSNGGIVRRKNCWTYAGTELGDVTA